VNFFIDLETHPDLAEGAKQRYIDTVEPPGNYKKPESIAEWKAQNGERIGVENWSKTALDPMCGGIYVFGYSLEGETPITLVRELNEPEGPFLTAALEEVNARIDKAGQPRILRWIGWNLSGFDLPFLAKRLCILGAHSPLCIPVGAKNGEYLQDLMLTWSGYRGFDSQKSVADAMGIPVSTELDGAGLWERGPRVAAEKCASDLQALISIHSRMAPVFRV
jgi:hypothetical protein